MTSESELLLAICENPDDVALRLVMADWLEERGDPKAEFIRVQCELYGCKFCTAVPCHPHVPLRRRERKLLQQYGVEWVRPIHGPHVLGEQHRISDSRVEFQYGDGQATHSYEFRRGFVEVVRCTLVDWYGEECGECSGSSRILTRGGRSVPCGKCDGTGRLNAHGPEIVAAAPVMRVEFSDLRPIEIASVWNWMRNRPEPESPWFLPGELWVALDLPLVDVVNNAKFAPTENEAVDALSLSAIDWARRIKGMEPLTQEQVR